VPTPPSPWLVTGLVLGSVTALAVYLVQALQHARVLPEVAAVSGSRRRPARRTRAFLLVAPAGLAAVVPADGVPLPA
jgi:hypothetical protein